MSDSRTAIRAAARQLFSERGYAAVTVREIARRAEVSPALVMKLHGSKAELYAEVGPGELRLRELDVPVESLGRAMVLLVLNRRERGDAEPWCALAHRSPGATTAGTDEELRDGALTSVTELIGDTTPGRRHASAVICHMVGLARGLRVLGLFPEDRSSTDDIVATFAPVVQAHIDACRAPAGTAR